MEPTVGFEPTTACLQNRCSTTELSRQVTKSSGFSDCVYEVQSYSIALEDLVNKYQKNKDKYTDFYLFVKLKLKEMVECMDFFLSQTMNCCNANHTHSCMLA